MSLLSGLVFQCCAWVIQNRKAFWNDIVLWRSDWWFRIKFYVILSKYTHINLGRRLLNVIIFFLHLMLVLKAFPNNAARSYLSRGIPLFLHLSISTVPTLVCIVWCVKRMEMSYVGITDYDPSTPVTICWLHDVYRSDVGIIFVNILIVYSTHLWRFQSGETIIYLAKRLWSYIWLCYVRLGRLG